MSQSFYDILGVSKSANKTEIKKAFRDKAKKHHPDKGGDEAEFKKVNEAYETLSNDQKKAHYDQFGAAPGAGGGGGGGFGGGGFQGGGFSQGDFGGFDDIFSSFFGGGRGGGQQRGNNRGSDLEATEELSFEESMNGTTKSFNADILSSCQKCDGAGGTGQKTCSTCGGQGQVNQTMNTPFGRMQQAVTCPDCRGEGQSFESNCSDCQGEGRTKEKRVIEVKIPAGIADGATLRMRGKGEAGRRGGEAGDFFVNVRVKASSKFNRNRLDIWTEVEVSVFDALAGITIPVETFWGEVDLEIPSATRDRQTLRIKGKGVKTKDQSGDHLVKIVYKMPKKVSSKLKEKLQEAKKLSESFFG